jgi:hypothetical protein
LHSRPMGGSMERDRRVLSLGYWYYVVGWGKDYTNSLPDARDTWDTGP